MSDASLLPATVLRLRDAARQVAGDVLAPQGAQVGDAGAWPEQGLRALCEAGLAGLHVPARLGGHEEGMLALAVVTEELGRACGSTAMCFGMHSVATKVLAAKATAFHEQAFLEPIAAGRHLTTLALSEPGTGVHFFLPSTQFRSDGERVVLAGEKSFVTNGGHADSYVISAVPPGAELDPGAFSCFVVDAAAEGLEWLAPWDGFGMRGNSSRGLKLNDARIPRANLLGAEGDQIWYVFEVIAPYFIVAMSGVYLGLAQAALDETVAHLKGRSHAHTGEALRDVPVLGQEVAEMWIAVERTRQLVRHAARQGDAGDPGAALALFAAKADVAEMASAVTQRAMTLCGGRAYGANSRVARLLRDAQASHVMAPTTHLVKAWLGRSLLGLSFL